MLAKMKTKLMTMVMNKLTKDQRNERSEGSKVSNEDSNNVDTNIDNNNDQDLIELSTSQPAGKLDESLPKTALKRQWLVSGVLILGLLVLVGVVLVATKISNSSKPTQIVSNPNNKDGDGKVNIELANKALDPEKMWRNHFEDKLSANNMKIEEQLKLIEESFVKKEEQLAAKSTKELGDMQQKLQFALEELASALTELKKEKEIRQQHQGTGVQSEQAGPDEVGSQPAIMNSYVVNNERNIAKPKSARYFIPETAFVQGILLGGVSVSTAVGSSSEPTPVVIRIEGRGNLPKNFAVDLKTCRILGSSYGDLSSERVIIRAEVMSCHDEELEQIVTTKIAGVIHGDDGLNGIKGKVVQTSNRQVQQALIGGLLSGLANTAKAGEQLSISGSIPGLGSINTAKSSFKERLRDNSLAGVGNAGDKIASYYLKQAESMSPVLQIPGAARVDIVFTKGVYLGSTDVREKLELNRKAGDGYESR